MRSVASTAAFSTPPPAAFSTPPPTAFSASPPRGLLRASTPGLLRVLWADPVSARDVAYPSYCQKIAKNYRKERWSAILADVLDMSLECARQLKRIDDEILFSLELITEGPTGPHTLAEMNGAGSRTGNLRSGGGVQPWQPRWSDARPSRPTSRRSSRSVPRRSLPALPRGPFMGAPR